jgi:hypothetical protein
MARATRISAVSPAVVWKSEYKVERDAAAAPSGRGCPKLGVSEGAEGNSPGGDTAN